MTFTPTPEQLAVIEAAKTTSSNLIISALAGAAKTSTLVLLAEALTGKPILSLAFNKKISEEMKARLPSHCDSKTLNSLGHRVWGEALGKRLRLDTNKGNDLLRAYTEKLKSKEEKEDFREAWGDILRTFRLAKASGYIPAGALHAERSLTPDFYETLEEELPFSITVALDWMLRESIKQSYEGLIDFDDQIYMPTLFGGSFPSYPIVMVDEAQDLSPLNHAMIRKLCARGSRLIAVGDPNQAIYGFRGALASSMEELRREFNMVSLPLTTSFRCPSSIVENVRWLAPEMKWPEWAKAGRVETHQAWNTSTIPDGAAIVCRNNAPLFWLAFQLLKAKRGVKLLGADIGPQLVKILKKLGPASLSRGETLTQIELWEKAQEKKSRSTASLRDKAECLRIFANMGDTLGEAIAMAEHILKQEGAIQLMSVHKSKGLEFDIVFHLDKFRCKIGEDPQERNIRYVADTRAKSELHYIERELYNA